jgi:pseudaminic acid cytidylyltransferase
VNKIICIIPARKGSKRVKNKNFKFFYGKPIITHVIQNLKKFNIFDKIVVSTNSNKIQNIAKKLGVEVIVRSEKLSSDFTDTKTVVIDAIKKLEKKKLTFNKVICVYPTSIFLKIKYLKLAIDKLKKRTSFVYSAKKYEHTIFRSFYKNQNGRIKLNFKKDLSSRTQSFKDTYHDAAQFYLGWKNSWLSEKEVFNERSDFVLFSRLSSCDIDSYEDWMDAKVLWKIKKKINKS